MKVDIRRFHHDDWGAVRFIYQQGIETRMATFETVVPDLASWLKKFHEDHLWVALITNKIVGWAGLQPVSVRKVYEGVMEVTIYVDSLYTGKGVGKTLMTHLINQSEIAGVWTLYASIFPENTASIQLHMTTGFREIGYREKIAQIDGNWKDTVLFERRSKIVGV